MDYTKGPWRNEGRYVMALKNKQVCAIPGDHIKIAKVDEANAQLIAASPDMYEALKAAQEELKHVLSQEPYSTVKWHHYGQALAKIDGALSKAEGK